jgi:hypothetical protein
MTGRMTGRMDEKDDHHHRNRTKCKGGEGSGSLSRSVLAKFAALAWSPSFSSCHLYSPSTCLLFSISELSIVFLASTHIFQKASALHYHLHNWLALLRDY